MKTQLRAKGAGAIEWRNGHAFARVSLPDGTRPRYPLCKLKLTGECTCKGASEAKLADMAQAVSERERARVAAELRVEAQAQAERRLTVQQFGELWTSGKLYERHGQVRGLKPKKSAHDDELRLQRHVYPYIGNLLVSDVSEVDIERALAKASAKAQQERGRPWRQATRFQVYQVMRRLFELAVKPGRLRTDNPVSRDLHPPKDSPKLYSFLYPDEVLGLLACRDVAIGRRVYYALAVYTGLRKGSLRALKWGAVDFTHRTLTSLESKTGLPQIFEIPPDLVTLLQGWYERLGRPKAKEPIVQQLECMEDREAETLRADLKRAKVEREILFSTEVTVEPLRFHDMRATFVTWARRDGRGWGWISDRTGHLTEEMQRRYDRGARMLADLQYRPFPDITSAIPELAELPSNVVRVDFRGSA